MSHHALALAILLTAAVGCGDKKDVEKKPVSEPSSVPGTMDTESASKAPRKRAGSVTQSVVRPPAGPQVRLGAVSVEGSAVAKEIVVRVLRGREAQVLGCYKKALADAPGLFGQTTASMTLATNGAIKSVGTEGIPNQGMRACLASVLEATLVPRSDGGPALKVTATWAFEPTPRKKK